MDNTRLFNIINLANCIIAASMSIIVPFFPPFAEEQGLSSTLIGFIFSAHPLGGVLASFYIGKLLNKQNRMSIIMLSMLLECIVMTIFTIQYYIPSYIFLITSGLIARFFNGFAYSMLVTAFYSMIPTIFPEQKEQKIAAAETAAALGFVFGPVAGSLLFRVGGYTLPFIVQALLTLASGIYIQFFLNNNENIIQSNKILFELLDLELVEKFDDLQVQKPESVELNYNKALRNIGFSINAIVSTLTNTMICYQFPIIALYLLKQFNIDSEHIGAYVLIFPLSYAISSIGLVYIPNPNKIKFILYGQLIHALAQFYYGPDVLFTGIHQNLIIFCVAQFIAGMAATPGVIYCLPQMTECLLREYPKEEEKATNISTAVFTAGCFIGDFIGPVISGFLNNYTDYSRIASIFGIIALIMVGVYYKIMCMTNK